jgi:hypothetical protein
MKSTGRSQRRAAPELTRPPRGAWREATGQGARFTVCRGMWTRGCCSIGAICSHAPACRRCPLTGPASCARSMRCSAPARRIRCCCRCRSSSRCWRWRCSRTNRCCATVAASATSAAPGFGARCSSTWIVSRAAMRRRPAAATSPTCGRSSAAARSPASSPARGTSANSIAACPRTCARAGAPPSCPAPAAPVRRRPEAPAW